MALIFPRLARNFVKDGYFPTDSETLKRIASAIDPEPDRDMARIIDPCCGEGAALIELSGYFKQAGRKVTTYGVEIDTDRAWHAKNLLDHVAHANIEHVWMSHRSCGFLFLNPPYGDMISDKGDIGAEKQLRRFEAHFMQQTADWLQPDGLMALVVPFYIVDEKFAALIASSFSNTSIWLAPVQDFKQCVIFGIKRRKKIQPTKRDISHLVVANQTLVELPEVWPYEQFTIPSINRDTVDKFTFKINRIDAEQLEAELAHRTTLWAQYKAHFGIRGNDTVRPLMPMSQWHLALALVSGQINGFVESQTGERFLVKGSTHKTKQRSTETEDGKETMVMLDRFEPRIVGFNLTPGQDFGSVIHIVNRIETTEAEPETLEEEV